jgi:hypothetical protein
MVRRMQRTGDYDGADKWLRVIVAIGELGEPCAFKNTYRIQEDVY